MTERSIKIALMPFENLSGTPDGALLAAGFVQDLITEIAHALWRFTRAMAFTSLPADRFFGNNSGADLLEVATFTLDGEMAAKKDKFEEAIALLKKGAAKEDALRYDEPPDWIQPVRHTLGAVLLRAGRAAEAEQVYREDLDKYKENGWSLMGLRDSLAKQGKKEESDAVDARFRKAWANADVAPSATCFCQAKED